MSGTTEIESSAESASPVDALVMCEQRIHNLEVALAALSTLLHDTLPPSYADDINLMMNDFFNGSESLGAFKDRMFFTSNDKTRTLNT